MRGDSGDTIGRFNGTSIVFDGDAVRSLAYGDNSRRQGKGQDTKIQGYFQKILLDMDERSPSESILKEFDRLMEENVAMKRRIHQLEYEKRTMEIELQQLRPKQNFTIPKDVPR